MSEPTPSGLTLTIEEANRVREWFNALQDLGAKMLDGADQALGAKVTAHVRAHSEALQPPR